MNPAAEALRPDGEPLARLLGLLNPFAKHSRAPLQSRRQRLIRASLISTRNALLCGVLLLAVVWLIRVLPAYGMIPLALGLAIAPAAWVRARDRRGEAIRPLVLLGIFAASMFVLGYTRSLADANGFHIRYSYVIRADEFLFGGMTPTVWLQAHLFHFPTIGLLDSLCIVVYCSYYPMPPAGARTEVKVEAKRLPSIPGARLSKEAQEDSFQDQENNDVDKSGPDSLAKACEFYYVWLAALLVIQSSPSLHPSRGDTNRVQPPASPSRLDTKK